MLTFLHPYVDSFGNEVSLVRDVLQIVRGLPGSNFSIKCFEVSYKISPFSDNSCAPSPQLAANLERYTNAGASFLRLSHLAKRLGSTDGFQECLTSQAFAAALEDYLTRHCARVQRTERQIFFGSNSDSILKPTLLVLELRLSPVLHDFNIVAKAIFEAVPRPGAQDQPLPAALCAAQLLSALYSSVRCCLMQPGKPMIDLLSIWISSIRPYIHLLESWLFKGEIADAYNEYMIESLSVGNSTGSDNWRNAFRIRSGIETISKLPEEQANGGPIIPVFLSKVAGLVLSAGKALNVLRQLNKTADFLSIKRQHGFLYEKLQNATKELYSSDFPGYASEPAVHESAVQTAIEMRSLLNGTGHRRSWRLPQVPQLQPKLAGLVDSPTVDILASSSLFIALERDDADRHNRRTGPRPVRQESTTDECCVAGIGERWRPLEVWLEEHLLMPIKARCERVNLQLVQVLFEDFKLVQHLNALRAVFFFAAGDVMHHFAASLFAKMDHSERWLDMHVLSDIFVAALSVRERSDQESMFEDGGLTMSDLRTCFNFGISSRSAAVRPIASTSEARVGMEERQETAAVGMQATKGIASLNEVCLNYTVKWPLNIVIDTDTVSVYNRIMVFMLQIRRAKAVLDQSRFAFRTVHVQHLHSVMLFHHELLHFVNNLYSFVISAVNDDGQWRSMTTRMHKSSDVEDLCRIHAAMLIGVRDRCLLNPKAEVVYESIVKQLDLVLRFSKEMKAFSHAMALGPVVQDSGHPATSVAVASRVSRIARDFHKINRFLLLVLDRVVRHASHPWLEELLLRLDYNLHYSHRSPQLGAQAKSNEL